MGIDSAGRRHRGQEKTWKRNGKRDKGGRAEWNAPLGSHIHAQGGFRTWENVHTDADTLRSAFDPTYIYLCACLSVDPLQGGCVCALWRASHRLSSSTISIGAFSTTMTLVILLQLPAPFPRNSLERSFFPSHTMHGTDVLPGARMVLEAQGPRSAQLAFHSEGPVRETERRIEKATW